MPNHSLDVIRITLPLSGANSYSLALGKRPPMPDPLKVPAGRGLVAPRTLSPAEQQQLLVLVREYGEYCGLLVYQDGPVRAVSQQLANRLWSAIVALVAGREEA
jgi:hypothetical protein